jgi:predicted SprT family Zn-dependent metalloprotease
LVIVLKDTALSYSFGVSVEVEKLASALFQKHGLVNYSFGFDRAVRRAGLCNYTQKRITLSKHFVQGADMDSVEQVLLHEIAHALSGQAAGHGRIWKAKATELGYRHERLTGEEISKSTAKWVGVCPNQHSHYRMRKPTRMLSCKHCAPVFSKRYLISWTTR